MAEVWYVVEGTMINGQVRPAANPIHTIQYVGPPPINIGQKLGLICLNLFIFFSFSRVLDMALSSLRLPLILGFLTAAVVLFDGGFPRAFSSNITRALGAFTVWACIGLPFSYWRTGSLNELKDTWLKTMIVFIAIAGLVTTYKRLRTILFTMACAFATATLLLVTMGVESMDGRLGLAGGELANANQAALAMMLGLSLAWYVVTDKTRLKPVRFLFALTSLFMVRVILRTGSRSALIALLVMFLFLFLAVSFVSKVKLLIIGAAVAFVGFAVLPGVLKARYSTLVSDEVVYGDDVTSDIQESARLSSTSRKDLLKGGLVLTARNPLFGVGMGNFAAASNERSLLEKKHMDWSVSHNSYVQLSSETGIPGFIFYTLSMLFAWLRTGSVMKRAKLSPEQATEWAEMGRVALCLRIGMVGLFVLMFFGSIAYENYFPCFAGLAVALEWSAKQVMISESAAVPSMQPPPLMGRKPRLARRQNQPLPV